MKKIISLLALFFVTNCYSGPGHQHNHDDHLMSNGQSMTGHWMAPATEQTVKNPVSVSAESIAIGKKHYHTFCAICHGASGKGDGPAGQALNPKPTDLSVMVNMHPAGDLAWKIKNGRGAMPAWKGTLSNEEIWHVINYLKTLSD